MSVKNIIGFILPIKAFSPRNLTSFGLVILFCVVFVLAGGKFETKNLHEIRKNSLNSSGFHPPIPTVKNQIKITGDVKRSDTVGTKIKKQEDVQKSDISEEVPNSSDDELAAIKARFEKSKKNPKVP